MASSFRYDEPARDNTSTNAVSLGTIAKARLVLGADYNPAGKSEAEVLRAVAASRIGAAKASGKSEVYLRAMLDVASDMAKEGSAA
jgi:hypothetical protein